MKKNYLNITRTVAFSFILFLASLSIKSSAQTIVEGFDDITTLAASGWSMQNLSSPIGITDWFQGNPLAVPSYNGAADSYIGANFNNCAGTGTISNWLFTPNRTLNNGDAISFFTRSSGDDIWPDRLQVRMSLNGSSTNAGATANSVGDFTTLLLDINPTLITGVYPIDWQQYTITLSGLPGPTSGRLAFRYFVTNGGPNGANSDYIGIDQFVYEPICGVTIPGNAIAENEACSADADGGCNAIPIAYQDITCGTTVSGTSWWDGTTRDTDWFRFVVTASTTATITASAEFMFQLFFVDITGGCGSLAIVGTGATGNPCQVVTYSEALAPGTYVAFIASQFDVPAFTCSNNPRRNYYLTLTMPGATPTVTASGPLSFCQGDSVTLTSSASTSYLWSDGSTTQSIVVTTSGNYTVTVGSTNGCPATSAPTSVTVNAAPTVSITGVNYACSGNTTTLTANAAAGSGSITGYQWQESNVDISGETNSTYGASTAGSYTVIVTNSNGCSTTSAPFTFTIANNPAVNITGDTSSCAGSTLTANATAGSGNISGYQWQESNVDISGATDSTYNVTASGSYTVIVTNSFGCTAVSAPIVVTVNAAPTVSITGINYACAGNSTNLTANATAGSGNITGYQWQESSVDITGETNSTYTASTAGVYTVIVTNSNGCSTTSAPFTFTIANQPTVNITGNTAFCPGDSTTLAANATAGSGSISGYQWQESNIDIASANSATYNASTIGSYTVVVTNTFGCTQTSAPFIVTAASVPTVAITGASSICSGDSVMLTASSTDTIAGYQWQLNTSDIGGATDSSYYASVAGDYTVVVTNAAGCSATSSIATVTVLPLPTAGFSYIVIGDSVAFTNTSADGTTYSWDFDDGSPLDNNSDPSHIYTANGSYDVTLIVTNSCGTDTIVQTVIITSVGIPSAAINTNVFHVYPNPVSEILNFDLNVSAKEDLTISIINSLGQLKYSENRINVSGDIHVRIYVADLAGGWYTLQVAGSQSISHTKFVKQ